MPDIIQDTPAPVTTPPVETPPPSPDNAPLSEHIEQFHAQETPAAERPEPRPRHRSQKNLARAEDVPRIKELTTKVRELEEKLAARATPPAPSSEPAIPPYTPPPPVTASTFDEPEPQLGDAKYADAADPYSAWQRDLARYDRKKEAWEAKQQEQTAATTAQQQAFEAAAKQRAETYTSRLQSYIAQHPERQAAFAAIPTDVNNPLVVETIWGLEDGPEVLYALLQQPALFNELLFLTDGKPVSAGHVARTTQWLRARLQAGSTGAAVRESPPPSPAPRPPTPVRTRPMPPSDGPPDDGAPLMEHQRYFKSAR